MTVRNPLWLSTPTDASTIATSTLPLASLPSPRHRGFVSRLFADARALAATGTTLVDITDTWLPIDDLGPKDARQVIDALAAVGLAICGVSLVRRSVIDPIHSASNREHARRGIAFAAQAGSACVSIGFHEALRVPGDVPFWAVEAPLGDRADPCPVIRVLADEAGKSDVELALELYEGGPLGSGRGAVDLVERIDRPNVGINFDVGNLYRSPMSAGETWRECLEATLPHMRYWHMKNYRRVHEYPTGRWVGSVPTTLADGDIDYRTCVRRALESGYRGPFVLEQYGGDGLAAQATGVRYVATLLAELS